MFVLIIFALITFCLAYLFHLLTKEAIAEAYEKLPDKNPKIRKIKAFFVGVFHLIAF